MVLCVNLTQVGVITENGVSVGEVLSLGYELSFGSVKLEMPKGGHVPISRTREI